MRARDTPLGACMHVSRSNGGTATGATHCQQCIAAYVLICQQRTPLQHSGARTHTSHAIGSTASLQRMDPQDALATYNASLSSSPVRMRTTLPRS